MDNSDRYSYELDRKYLFWMIDFFCMTHKDLKKVIKIVEDMTEEYHNPDSPKYKKAFCDNFCGGSDD